MSDYTPTPPERECMAVGTHLGIRRIPHNEICEQPWNVAHREASANLVDMLCMHCDSDWLSSETDFTYMEDM